MRIAVCLYGYFNNRRSPNTGSDGHAYIMENICKGRNVDFFIHSWDLNNESHIKNIYKPIKYIFEPQKDFIEETKHINPNNYYNPNMEHFRTMYNSLSFYYSRKKSIELKMEYELDNKFIYDCVLSCRFDLGQMDKYNGGGFKYKVSEINFNPDLDMNYMYSAMWDQLNAGYADQWFYGSSENMDLLGTMYDKALYYFTLDSNYQKALFDWPDSDALNEFSNQMFLPEEEKTKNRVKYNLQNVINNHLMHKWFFIDSGLYQKSKFV